MVLEQIGYSCDYELNIFINIFFDKDEEGKIKTEFFHENDIIKVDVTIDFNGKTYKETCTENFSNSISDKKIIKKIYGTAVCKAFVKTAEKIRKIKLPWGVMSGIRPAKNVRQFKESGKSEEEIKNILKNIYNISPEKADLAIKVAKNEEKILEKIKKNSVSLYIGIPFCPSRCLYCSFVSTDVKISGKYMDEFSDKLATEIKKTGEILKRLRFFVQTIYIGGGTPTTLSAENLEKIYKSIKENIDLTNLEEFTLEAGRPDTVTYEKLKLSKDYGVNRVSINPQTLNEETLKTIGRNHTIDMFYDAFEIAKNIGFESINTDLIAGLPDENFDKFKKSIDKITELNPQNITVHSMCVKRAARLNFSDFRLTGYNEMNKMLTYTEKLMKKSGYEPYYMYRQKNISGNLENVGYAKEGKFAQYNINIMEEAQTIIALGGGGASKIVLGDRIERVVNFKEPYEYIRRFDEILDKKEEIASYFEKGE